MKTGYGYRICINFYKFKVTHLHRLQKENFRTYQCCGFYMVHSLGISIQDSATFSIPWRALSALFQLIGVWARKIFTNYLPIPMLSQSLFHLLRIALYTSLLSSTSPENKWLPKTDYSHLCGWPILIQYKHHIDIIIYLSLFRRYNGAGETVFIAMQKA